MLLYAVVPLVHFQGGDEGIGEGGLGVEEGTGEVGRRSRATLRGKRES